MDRWIIRTAPWTREDNAKINATGTELPVVIWRMCADRSIRSALLMTPNRKAERNAKNNAAFATEAPTVMFVCSTILRWI